MQIKKDKNTTNGQWMLHLDDSQSKPKLNASTYSVRTMDNMGLLEDKIKQKKESVKRLETTFNTYRSVFQSDIVSK